MNRLCVVAYILLIGTLMGACKGTSGSGFGPGQSPPQFELESLSGKRTSLIDYSGRVTLLNFWATWCAPCIEEASSLEALHKNLSGQDFAVLGIASEGSGTRDEQIRKVNEFVATHGITFPILMDFTGSVASRYKVQGYPESILVDRNGKVIMFEDPESRSLSTRFVGPRPWSSNQFLDLFKKLLRP